MTAGLDAAGPGFENTDAGCRLDHTDASFVDVIHTSSNNLLEGGAGIEQKVIYTQLKSSKVPQMYPLRNSRTAAKSPGKIEYTYTVAYIAFFSGGGGA